MTPPSILTILHLSDFHYTKRKRQDQKIVVDALVKDLENLCIGHRRPDIIVFTGDLVNAGEEDSHEEAYDFLLSRIAQATKCSDERIYIIPGNHDLSRRIVKETATEHHEWRENCGKMDQLNNFYADPSFSEIIRRKFDSYYHLEKYLNDSTVLYKNAFSSIHHIDTLNVDIINLNTAVFSVGGLPHLGHDDKILAIPEHAILDLLQYKTPDAFRIFTTHHPLQMLDDNSSRYLSSIIENNANMYLHGHMHDPQTRNSTNFSGQLFSDQGGAVFTHRRDAYIGYSLISVAPERGYYETRLRTYFDDRKEFDNAIDVVRGGLFHSSHEARQWWRDIATPINEKYLREHLDIQNFHTLQDEMGVSETDRDAHDKFVPPPMKRNFVQPSGSDDAKGIGESVVSFEDLVFGNNNVILYAAAEYGRTTVLKEMMYRHFGNSEKFTFPRVPVIIDFSDVRHNIENLLRFIRSSLPNLPDGVNINSLLQLGYICIMFDDVIFSDSRSMSILRKFIKTFPKARYVLSCVKHIAWQYGSHVNPEMPIHFDFVELCELRRRDMRQLVVKYNNCTDVDTILDRLQSEFREINLPFTAANGSILMTIYESQSKFQPINRSVLIEQFIDTILKKAALEQSRRETFDYANKTSLLSHIAS
ncbi:MAG: metallophosphoesterase, partial [Zavarzinia sp.]|nr:metallophosphoesterase [Zavarzinia sp.]